jgi:hypothetical protein
MLAAAENIMSMEGEIPKAGWDGECMAEIFTVSVN